MAGEKAGVLAQSGVTIREYLRKILLPSLLASIVTFVAITFLGRLLPIPTFVSYALYAIPLLPMLYALAYPYAKISSKRVQINSKIPFFATYFAVMSTSDVSREELIWSIATEKILEPIASDMKKVYYLMAKLHRSMPEALRFLSKRTPSKVFADFLERLAYSLDSGVELKDYLLQEQETVMDDYETFYEGALYDLDVFKEVYSSLIISVVFMVTFVIIGPIITGQDVGTLSLFMFILVMITEVGVMLVIKYRMPEDKIWSEFAMNAFRKSKIMRGVLISLIGSIIAVFVTRFIIAPRFNIPILIQLAIITSPLAYLGKVFDREEKSIMLKDENFPAFMRSLSSSLAASGASLSLVLKYLSAHDFGVLTRDIKNLYKRLSMRIDNRKSWRYFAIDTGSWLIDIFSDIFNKSISLGADPEYVGTVISRNFERLIRLRRKRIQTVSSFKGVIYGITGAFAFSVASAFQVTLYMNKLSSNLEIQGDFLQNVLFLPSESTIQLTELILVAILVTHCLISSLSIKFADGGHFGNLFYYFAVLMWLAALGDYIGSFVMSKMMSFASVSSLLVWSSGVVP
ncbi:MAG: archaeal flagellar protein FlaJ [Thermococcaceae archaeon]|nr:archaeal flagellar protein FlaJ [Thermococcaceae archaeon]